MYAENAKDEVTHNHPEGIKGAEATAVATFLALTDTPMDDIKAVVVRGYYPLGFTLDEIRPIYEFDGLKWYFRDLEKACKISGCAASRKWMTS